MSKIFNKPIFLGADPFIMSYGGKYYVYCTTQTDDARNQTFTTSTTDTDGFMVYESTDLINWENKGYCLKKGDGVIGEKWFWAPEVTYYNNKFYMVYTAEEHMAIAVADSPLGPFRQEEKRWLRESKSIDGHILLDGGNAYLYYVRLGGGNRIFVAKLTDDLLSIEEEYESCLIEATEPWETIDCKVAEGPFVLKHKGLYYLSYSCNHTRCKDYAVGYAVSDSPIGPFKRYKDNPILSRNGEIWGLGHHSFCKTVDGKGMLCSYHCHGPYADSYKPRRFCLATAEFKEQPNGEDILVINGPVK